MRAVSGNRISSAMRSAPIWVGSTTLLAPAWISLLSVEGISPRAIISRQGFSARADRVIKTLAASLGSTLARVRARPTPASSSDFSLVASPTRHR